MPESIGIEVNLLKAGELPEDFRGHPGNWIDEREIDVPVQVHKAFCQSPIQRRGSTIARCRGRIKKLGFICIYNMPGFLLFQLIS